MTFAWPHVLWALALPLFWAVRQWQRRGPAGPAADDPHPHIATAEAAGAEVRPLRRPRPRRPRAWVAAGFACALVALARPQWGRTEEPETESAREILIALDLSRSMLTADVTPSRLERAKLLIQSLLDQLQGERVGLMIFAGSPFLQAPLSSDYDVLREFLPELSPDYLPDAGTDFGALLAAAPPAFSAEGAGDRFLVLLSDGGANDTAWAEQIDQLKRRAIRVIALGVGTAGGGFIPDGMGGYMKDERGAVVLAKLESGVLRRLADATGGVYRDASDWVDVAGVVRSTVAAGREGRFQARRTGRPIERFQWPLAAALLCWLLSLWREFPVKPRPRALRWAAALVFLPLCLHAAPPAAAPGELLGKVVDRLSGLTRPPAALDWAEMAQDTLTWGREFAEAGQAVPPGPVHDGLDAVAAGRGLDRRAADWDQLAKDLGALLKAPPPPKDQPKPQQNQQQPNQQEQQQQQDSASQQQQQQQQDQSQSPSADHKDQPPPSQTSPSPSAPPPPASTPDEAAQDPSLAAPLQQLDEVRSGDSPAELFRMLQRQNPSQHPPPKTSKPW